MLNLKRSIYTSIASLLVLQANFNTTLALQFEGTGENDNTPKGSGLQNDLEGTTNDFSTAVQNIITYLTYFLYIVAVVFALWGGFQILTAAGDEEKVKKGKTILIQAAIGLFVIFIASSLVQFVINTLAAAGNSSAGTSDALILSLI